MSRKSTEDDDNADDADADDDKDDSCGGDGGDFDDMHDPFVSDDDNDPHFVEDFDNNADISEKLYPSSKFTVMKSLALLFSWFCSSPCISKESFGGLLNILNKFILPE